MEDWERILLLMRGQDISYSEISKFVHKPENQLKVYYARLKKKLLEDMNETLSGTNNGK
jgi:DNA-directed RNA polymerase specialized sigma24 family protein